MRDRKEYKPNIPRRCEEHNLNFPNEDLYREHLKLTHEDGILSKREVGYDPVHFKKGYEKK